jgi:hypothetical protein
MNDTPRMTEAWSKASRTADGMYSSRPCHIDIAANCYKEGCEIERELTAVTEQRDGLRSGIEYASDQLTKVTNQRDRLAEALLELRNNESLSLGGAAYKIVEQALQYEMVEQSLQSLTPKDK